MMTISSKQWLIALALTLTFSFTALAGSQANQASTHEPEQIVSFAKNVEKYAAGQGASIYYR